MNVAPDHGGERAAAALGLDLVLLRNLRLVVRLEHGRQRAVVIGLIHKQSLR